MKRPYPCKICNYEASKKSHLSQHDENVHQNSEKIMFTECNKSIQKRSLSGHMKKFHSGEQSQHGCRICTFHTIYKSYLKEHVKHVHQKRK